MDDQGGTPQPSLDIDANRLVLLDRAENGDNGHSENPIFPSKSAKSQRCCQVSGSTAFLKLHWILFSR